MWTKLWCLEHFIPRIITIPRSKQELVTHPNSTKIDRVELEANLGHVYVEDDKEENVGAVKFVGEKLKYASLAQENHFGLT